MPSLASTSRKASLIFLVAGAIALLIGAASTRIFAFQTASAPKSFDAASIKPAAVPAVREGGNRSRIEHTPTSLSMWNVSIADCVQWAYSVASFQVSAEHVTTDSYDILAKTEAPVSVEDLRVMLQDLLATRFHLALHRETRLFPVYVLVVAKGGPKLPPRKPGASRQSVQSAESLPRVHDDSFLFAEVSMPQFSRMLSQLRGIELPVIDQTGISGTFDIELKSAPSAARIGDTGALFSIVQEQLGLKLAATKAPFEVLVIDRAEKPTAN